MQELAQSKSPDMAKFRLPMVYENTLPADYSLDVGDLSCAGSFLELQTDEMAEILEMAFEDQEL